MNNDQPAMAAHVYGFLIPHTDCESFVASNIHQSNDAIKPSNPDRVRQKFPKSGRLLKHADFDKVYKGGKRYFSGNMTVFYLRRASLEEKEVKTAGSAGTRIGITVGRVLGGAVIRNRIKRRIREAVRQHRQIVSGTWDVVINPKKSVLNATFTDLTAEMRQAFEVIAGMKTGPVRNQS